MSDPNVRGPVGEAWLRLRKNRLAMVGLVTVFVMSLLCGFSSVLPLQDPSYGYGWIGATPPGSRHPDVLERSLLTVGQPPHAAESWLSARALQIDYERKRGVELRVFADPATRRVTRIVRRITEVQAIPAREGGAELVEVLAGGGRRAVPAELRLEVGQELPAALGPVTRLGRIFQLLTPTVGPRRVSATLVDGRVATLSLNDQPVQTVVFAGRDVESVRVDGRVRTVRHWLGTDGAGRDQLSRILYGGRISLMVGLVATLVSLLIGVVYGAVAGYCGGKVDQLMMGLVDLLYGIPYMFLVILLLVNFGRNLLMLFVALGAVQWLTMSRVVRGQILSLREREFIEAARMSGTSHFGILFGHLIPNTFGVVVIFASLMVPSVILQESFLAFIGLTVEYEGRSLDSWGALVKAGSEALGSDGSQSWLLLGPALAMSATLVSLHVLGDGLRDALDPRQRGKG